ncbi:hypothetical protein [Novimethylophilus kurashikiensis]|nr:hypothetical protein [Novimethylophilus kurashikiensis]
MTVERYKDLLLTMVQSSEVGNKQEFASIIEQAYTRFCASTSTRITTEEFAQKLGLAGRVSVARQLLVGLGDRARMDPLKPDVPLSHTYWTVEVDALAELIHATTKENGADSQ